MKVWFNDEVERFDFDFCYYLICILNGDFLVSLKINKVFIWQNLFDCRELYCVKLFKNKYDCLVIG